MKRKREYTIYTIKARKMLELCKRKDRCFDLTSEYDRSQIVESVKTYAESALFYQIRKAVREAGGADSPDVVTSRIVYLFFENGVVNRDGEEDIKEEVVELLEEGVYLRFSGDKEFRRFVPFDKSASMSRKNTISFISEDVFSRVDVSLRLGHIWDTLDIEASKYYAYRGLYMTDGVEVPPSVLELNEKTVIVLDIDTMPVYEKVLTPKYADSDHKFDPDEDIIIRPEMMREREKFTSLPYDGEGLVCPQYAKLINKAAIEDKQTEATSFQIRMPYTKGMLHTVDFHKFLKDQFPDEDLEKLEITDCFGKKRKIADARIILTRSMFKCAGWLKQFYAIEGDKTNEYYANDPMHDYFKVFHKFNHAMYLVSSDANFRSDDYVKMNYQFLSTLDMDRESFRKMVEKHIEDTRQILSDPYKGRSAILRTDDSEDERINEDGDNELGHMDSWEYALKKNVSFVTDPKISKMVKMAHDCQIKDIRRGRLVVPGTVKYLSGDLLYLLTIIAERCGVKDTDRIKYLRDYRVLYPDRFYIAGRQKYKLDEKKYHSILRSPHLSRNEQCALRPVRLQIYNKYFSHLKGVIMVSDKSSVPAALGGADFDGDTVKIIRDDEINKAVFNSVYEKVNIVVETENGPIERTVNQRKIPVIDIVAPDMPGRRIEERITYEDIRRAFSSNVGKISNTALTISKLEYGAKAEEHDVPEGSTALCTIATGLEIDSVKTGIKPDTSELENLAADVKDEYLRVKAIFERIADNNYERDKVVHSEYNEKTGEYQTFFRFRKRRKSKKNIYKIGPEQERNIDLLPYYYARELAQKKTAKKNESATELQLPKYRFRFEEDNGWAVKAMQDPRLPVLMTIIGAYRKIIIDAWGFSRTREKTKEESLRGSLVTLLNTEYDRDMDKLYRSGASLDDGLETAYEVLYDAMPLSVNAREALTRMKEAGWQYIRSYEDKEAALGEIIGTEDIPLKAREILCDTYDNGYQFLNYILRDIALFRGSEESEAEDAEEVKETLPALQKIPKGKWKKSFDTDLYRKLHSDYRKTPENRTVWMKKAAGTCRQAVYDLFDGDIEEAIRCTLLLDGTNTAYSGDVYDENHTFLWDVFTAEDMSKVVFAEDGGSDA